MMSSSGRMVATIMALIALGSCVATTLRAPLLNAPLHPLQALADPDMDEFVATENIEDFFAPDLNHDEFSGMEVRTHAGTRSNGYSAVNQDPMTSSFRALVGLQDEDHDENSRQLRSSRCGDNYCSTSERCDSCTKDCGQCQPKSIVNKCVKADEFALTFDDAPNRITPSLLRLLEQEGVTASFFMDWVDTRRHYRTAKTIAEKGHYIGSAPYRLSSCRASRYFRFEMNALRRLVDHVTCINNPFLVRSPTSRLPHSVLNEARNMGYRFVTGWRIDHRSVSRCYRSIDYYIRRARGHGIMARVDTDGRYTLSVVRTIIQKARAAGFKFVTADRCAYGDNVPPMVKQDGCGTAVSPSRTPAPTPSKSSHPSSTPSHSSSSSMEPSPSPSETPSRSPSGTPTSTMTPSPTASVSPSASCGDGICGADEACDHCVADCGTCQPRTPVTKCVNDHDLALTFQTGPYYATNGLLDILQAKNAKASFFLLGSQISQAPEAPARITADGHYLGSNSMNHGDLTELTNEELRNNLNDARCAIKDAACVDNPYFLRVPFNSMDDDVLDVAQSMGYRVIQFNLDTVDWEAGVTAETVVQRFRDGIHTLAPQGIISVQHDWQYPSIEAVSEIIDLVRDSGYNLVTLPECVYGHDIPPAIVQESTCPAPVSQLPSPTASPSPAPVVAVCGDGRCDLGEQCDQCVSDCGHCQPTGNRYACVNDGDVAITFDDGPSSNTPALLDILADENVKVTFFLVGNMVQYNPEMVQREREEGHLIAQHTMTHTDLTTLDERGIRDELNNAKCAIEAAQCSRPVFLRQPYGATNALVEETAHKMGYSTVLWNLDTLDWLHAENDPNKVLENVENQLANMQGSGLIHLQHDLLAESIYLVPQILQMIRDAGYTNFVTMDKCLYGDTVTPAMTWSEERCEDNYVNPNPEPSPAPQPPSNSGATDPAGEPILAPRPCGSCWGWTKGYCKHPRTGICYPLLAKNGKCPSSTVACTENGRSDRNDGGDREWNFGAWLQDIADAGAQCQTCKRGRGRCIDSDGKCSDFVRGTTLCKAGCRKCTETGVSSKWARGIRTKLRLIGLVRFTSAMLRDLASILSNRLNIPAEQCIVAFNSNSRRQLEEGDANGVEIDVEFAFGDDEDEVAQVDLASFQSQLDTALPQMSDALAMAGIEANEVRVDGDVEEVATPNEESSGNDSPVPVPGGPISAVVVGALVVGAVLAVALFIRSRLRRRSSSNNSVNKPRAAASAPADSADLKSVVPSDVAARSVISEVSKISRHDTEDEVRSPRRVDSSARLMRALGTPSGSPPGSPRSSPRGSPDSMAELLSPGAVSVGGWFNDESRSEDED